MARIAGVDLPRSKRMEIALTYIFGIGRTRSREILTKADVSLDKRTDTLDEADVRRIRESSRPTTRSRATCAGRSQMNIKRLWTWAVTAGCGTAAACR